jgi:hypothetical protein
VPRAAPWSPLLLAALALLAAAAPAAAAAYATPAELGSAPAAYFKSWGGPYPLVVPSGKTVDVVVAAANYDAAPVTPGAVRLFFSSNASATASDIPGLGVCGTALAAASFTPPAKAIKPMGTAYFTVPGVPIPALAPGVRKAWAMIEPGEPPPSARARARAAPARARGARVSFRWMPLPA